MNNFIIFLETSIANIKNEMASNNKGIEELNNIKNTLIKISSNEIVEKETVDLIIDDINGLIDDDFMPGDIKTIKFVTTVLIPRKMKLDDLQISVLNKVINKIDNKIEKAKNNELLSTSLNEKKLLLDSLKSDDIFKNFDLLKKELKEYDVSNVEKIKIIKELIIKNMDKEEVENEEPEIIYDNSLDTIKSILAEFDYDIDEISEENKLILMSRVNLSNMREILEAFAFYEYKFNITKKERQDCFVTILSKSNKDFIHDIKRKCDGNGIDFIKYIDKFPQVFFISKSVEKNRSGGGEGTPSNGLIGAYTYFNENVDFFKEKGFSIPEINKQCPSILVTNSKNIRRNWDILSKVYDINLNETALSGLMNGAAVRVIDKYIESSKLGYRYISSNLSRLGSYSERLFKSIKQAELRDRKPFKINNNETIELSYVSLKETRLSLITVKPMVTDKTTKYDGLTSMLNNNPLDFDESKALLETLTEENKYVELIESKYKKDKYTYILGKTIVSRPKVIRILVNFYKNNIEIGPDEIKYALSYNSILTDGDLGTIENFENIHKRAVEREFRIWKN